MSVFFPSRWTAVDLWHLRISKQRIYAPRLKDAEYSDATLLSELLTSALDKISASEEIN